MSVDVEKAMSVRRERAAAGSSSRRQAMLEDLQVPRWVKRATIEVARGANESTSKGGLAEADPQGLAESG